MVCVSFTSSYVVMPVFHPVSSLRNYCKCTSAELFAGYIFNISGSGFVTDAC